MCEIMCINLETLLFKNCIEYVVIQKFKTHMLCTLFKFNFALNFIFTYHNYHITLSWEPYDVVQIRTLTPLTAEAYMIS